MVQLLREVKGPLRIVLCQEIPNNLINVLGHFSVILHPLNFCKVKFRDASSTGKIPRKSATIL